LSSLSSLSSLSYIKLYNIKNDNGKMIDIMNE
jgi:hypothetical protein